MMDEIDVGLRVINKKRLEAWHRTIRSVALGIYLECPDASDELEAVLAEIESNIDVS